MKGKVFLKRPKVDWHLLMLLLGDQAVEEWYLAHFHQFIEKKIRGNRIAYYALLHVYGKARLDAYRYTGVWNGKYVIKTW